LALVAVAVGVSSIAGALEPIFIPVKIDGPVHDPPNGTFWYGPFAEGVAVFDVNGDGILDITCGANWYQGPDWRKHGDYRSGAGRSGEFISDNGEFPLDVDGDGRLDLISSGWMANGVFWYRNPGRAGVRWEAHKIMDSVQTEGFIAEDVDGDGDPDLLINHWDPAPDQGVTWIENRAGGAFLPHVIGTDGDTHGIGLGDLNLDGRKDIITPRGWYEAPEDRATGTWRFHADFDAGRQLGIRMIVYDVNGDGLPDIICGKGHDYGLFWLERLPGGPPLEFERRVIEDSLGQFHTLVLADVNQDGRPDLVTGKRLRGHGGDDPSSFDPLGLFWYEIEAGGLVRHVLAFNHVVWYPGAEERNPPPNCAIGTGMNINVVDVNGDGRVDIVVAGKSGLYLLENRGSPPTPRMDRPRQAEP